MRKLLDDRLIKLIDNMSENPYEYYRFEGTRMTTLDVESVETASTGASAQVYLEGEIEPYTTFNNSDLDLGLTAHASGMNTVSFYFPKLIKEDFEINFYLQFPEGMEKIQCSFYFEGEHDQYFLYNDGDNDSYGIKLTGFGSRNDKQYTIFTLSKDNLSQEENFTIRQINGIVYYSIAAA